MEVSPESASETNGVEDSNDDTFSDTLQEPTKDTNVSLFVNLVLYSTV